MATPATLLARLKTRRRVSVFAYAMLTATLGVFGPTGPTPAHASVVDLVCAGTETVTYDPGITNVPQKVKITLDGALAPCKSLTNPTLVSATYRNTSQGVRSCLQTTVIAPYDITYKFNNGKYSTVRYNSATTTKVEGETVVTSTGTVVSGEFKGDIVTRAVPLVTPDPTKCQSPEGVTQITGPQTTTFTRP